MIKHINVREALSTFCFCALAVAFILGGNALAQTPSSRLPSEKLSWYGDPGAPNMSGVWIRSDDQGYKNDGSKEGWTPWPPPLKGSFLATWKARRADSDAGKAWDDPVARCVAPGMPRYITAATNPLLIIQSHQRVTMYRDGDTARRIWLDGRAFPAPGDLEPFPRGTAIGHYDGQDLVVESRGFRDMALDSTGLPHSDQMTSAERYHRQDEETLIVQVTVTDPLALSRPIKTTVTYKAVNDPLWAPKEFICTPKTDYHPERFIH